MECTQTESAGAASWRTRSATRTHIARPWLEPTSSLGIDEPDTAGFARARACPVAGENTPQNRGRCERRFLRYDGSNYDAGVLPASFCVVGSRGPPFSVTYLISPLHNCRSSNTR